MKFSVDSVLNPIYRNQVFAVLSINLIVFSHGIQMGWISPLISLMQSDESPLGRPITVAEASWVGSYVALGGVIGNIIFGYFMDKLGRKKTLILLAFPHMCLWVTVYFATEVYHFYIARLIAGTTGGGCFVAMPIIIAEVSDNRIRGRLGSMFIMNINTGIFVGFLVSTYIYYKTVACTIIILPLIYLMLVSFLPDTPQYLLKNDREEEAKTALKFYKNYKGTTKEEFKEFNQTFIELKDAILCNKGVVNKVEVKDFCNRRAVIAILTGFALMVLNQFCGGFAIVSYSSTIFAQSGSQMDPNTNTIILGLMQILGTYTSTLLVDKYGRKILLVTSSSGMSVGLAVAGAYEYLSHSYDLTHLNWIPLVALSFAVFIACIGLASVTFVIIVELLPSKIRSVASTFCMIFLSMIAFLVLKIFPILMDAIEFSGIMGLCAVFCAIGAVFIVVCVPETKGKNLDVAHETPPENKA